MIARLFVSFIGRRSPRFTAKSEKQSMIAYVGGPCGHQDAEPVRVMGEQRARRFFKARQVSGDGGHKVVGPLPRLASPVSFSAGTPRIFDEFPQRHGHAARLRPQPFPMPGQQRNFSWHNPQFRPAPSPAFAGMRLIGMNCRGCLRLRRRASFTAGCRNGQMCQHLVVGSSCVDIERAAGRVVEDQHRIDCAAQSNLSQSQRNVLQRSRGNKTLAIETCKGV